MVDLVGLDADYAFLLDSNFPQGVQRMARARFIDEWRRSGGWGVTPLGTPPPPAPWFVR
jgi:hypothetical protein